ncbi:hypothetical protein FGIG_06180 [Fasciola gigantica]|uniref:Reverse transcriptase domain-containing protein n=1 Tax=Fasciola gigantica TaxID=46835 RepID=A0A504YF65_FASGI|nr:hypothetical protein FGIG_06180 [Fasciola gigantica]
MDEVDSNSCPAPSHTVSGVSADYLAYTDGWVHFADNTDRLRERLVALLSWLSASGMSINGNQSIKLTLEKDGKNGRIILWPIAYEVNRVHTQPLDVDQQVEYLDVQFKWKGHL